MNGTRSDGQGRSVRSLLAGAAVSSLWPLPLERALPVLRWLARWSRPRGPVSRWAREALQVPDDQLRDWWRRATFGARARIAVRERALAGRVDELAPLLLLTDLSPLREALAEGKGVILTGGHFGPPCAVRYMLMQTGLPRLSFTWDAHRWDADSLAVSDAANAARSLALGLDRLRTGGVLYTAVDTPRGSQTIPIPILGRETRLSRSLPTLARATGAPGLTVAASWEGERIRVSFGGRLPHPARADPESWDREWLTGYAQWCEHQMRGAPENVGLLQR